MPSVQMLCRPNSYRYTRESIERALTHHFGNTGIWLRSKNGYILTTGIGIVELKTLREAALFVIAMAEKERRMA